MKRLPPVLANAHLSSLMLGTGAALSGIACASLTGNSEMLPATLCIIFAIFAQQAGNFYYRFFDIRNQCGKDIDSRIAEKSVKTPSFTILKECSVAMVMLSAMVGFAIASMGGWWTLPVGIFIAVAGWLSCGSSMPLLRTPFGVVCSFILFGPVCVVATCLLQVMHESTGRVVWTYLFPSFYMAVVIGLMCVNATIVYGYANYYNDLRNSKVTIVGALGRRNSRILFFTNGIVYTAVTVAMCLQLHLDIKGLDMMPSIICFLIDLYIWWQLRTRPRYQIEPLIDLGNFNVLLMGLMSYMVFEITGTPDLSQFTLFGF